MQKLTDREISGKQRSLREFVPFCQKLLTTANLRSEWTKTKLRKRKKDVKSVMHARPSEHLLVKLCSVNLKLGIRFRLCLFQCLRVAKVIRKQHTILDVFQRK